MKNVGSAASHARRVKYAALNFSIPVLFLLLVVFAAAFAQGEISRVFSAAVCVGLMAGIRAAWQAMNRIERLIRQQSQAAAIAANARAARLARASRPDPEGPHLRVA